MAKPKKKAKKAASSRSRARNKSPSAASRSSAAARGMLSTIWKANPDTHFSSSQRDEINKKLASLIKGLEARQRSLIRTKVIVEEDKEINKRIGEAKKLRVALDEDFSTFLIEWNKRREHLRETRIKFLKGKSSDKGRIAVAAIEASLTKVFKPRSSSKASIASTTSPASASSIRRDSDGSLSSLSSEHKSDYSRSNSSASLSSDGSDNSLRDSSLRAYYGKKDEEKVAAHQQREESRPRAHYNLQSEFLATAEKKLETYLRHLQRSKQTPSDKVLPAKIDAVLDLLDLAKKGDMNGFIDEWKRTSSVIKIHRPKSLIGHKIKFTQAFPFEGQKLVQDLEKLEPDLYKASHKPSTPSSKSR